MKRVLFGDSPPRSLTPAELKTVLQTTEVPKVVQRPRQYIARKAGASGPGSALMEALSEMPAEGRAAFMLAKLDELKVHHHRRNVPSRQLAFILTHYGSVEDFVPPEDYEEEWEEAEEDEEGEESVEGEPDTPTPTSSRKRSKSSKKPAEEETSMDIILRELRELREENADEGSDLGKRGRGSSFARSRKLGPGRMCNTDTH